MNRKISLNSEEETKKFAEEFALELKKGDVIELIGDVGSGKTFFVRAMSKALGAKGASSPSFVIKNEYAAKKFRILHFDFYRLSEPGILKQELDESLRQRDDLIIIEWADTLKGLLPDDRYRIHFEVTGENARNLDIKK